MKPLDPRLLKYARYARTVLGVGGLLGAMRTLAVLAWCWLLANALAIVVLPVLGGMGGTAGRISEGSLPPAALPLLIAGALVAAGVRAVVSWGMDVLAARGAVRVKTQLRAAALNTIDTSSPVRERAGAADQATDAELATTLGRGLDALDGYFSNYLPQLILTAIATPILLVAVFLADPLSGTIALIVFPIIPVFMVLIGLATRAVQDRQWSQLQRLSASFLDAASGLATLKIFRREQRQSARIARETEEYRSRTMQVLRVTFLSGFVLDLAGTFSVALVAVTVGTRLVSGEFPLALGLFVLLLLPEVFIPIRQVGAAFHASTEGLAASGRVFELIEGSGTPAAVSADALRIADANGLIVDEVCISRGKHTLVGPVSLSVAPGEVVGLAGPSGVGKSTLLAAVLGFVAPQSGTIERPGEVSWAGQRAGLMQGSVAENVALGDDVVDASFVARALERVGLEAVSPSRQLGALGAGLSGGQAQRVAIARCLYRAWVHDTPLLLLDEPTSALDAENEALVAAALRAEADAGRAVLVVSHRQALLQSADRVVQFEGATV